MMAIFTGPDGAAAVVEAATGALGMAAGAAAELAWARALAPKLDARMQTNGNERFMSFYYSFILLD
jgi:hypothetical protein